MTTTSSSVPTAGVAATISPRDPAEDVRLARLHLRLGMLAAARAELEDLADRGLLDTEGDAVLAEARWRSGDLRAAEAAAGAHLRAGGTDPIALVVAAEAAAATGRPADARDFVARVSGLDSTTLERLFAGMPRRAHWPTAVGTGGLSSAGPGDIAAIRAAGGTPTASIRTSAVPGPADVLAANADLWDEAALTAAAESGSGLAAAVVTEAGPSSPPRVPTWVEPARARGHADPEAELETALEELVDAPERGLLRLALALRLDPTLAPDVLEAVRLRREPAAAVLRGDAQRLLGRHLEAEAAFADAIETIEREAIASGHHQPSVRPADRQEDS